MLIRNLQFDTIKYYRCIKSIANFLFSRGFSQIGLDGNQYIFLNTEELQATLKIMPIHLKIMARLGGDSNER